MKRWDISRIHVIAFAPFLIAILFWWINPNLAMDADSGPYIAGSPIRTATYPLFLDLTYGPALLPIQLALFAAALSWLFLYSSRFVPLIVSAALTLAIGANPFLWELQGTVMSEALTTPLFTVLVGLLIGFAYSGRRAPLMAAALICGLATTIRPSCLPLIAAPLCAIWIAPSVDRRIGLLTLSLILWASPIAVEQIYSRIRHGEQITSPLGRHAFMKAAVIDAAPTRADFPGQLERRLVQVLNDDFQPIRRTLDKAPDFHVRYILLTNYEGCVAWSCGDRITAGSDLPRPDIDRALLAAGFARLKTNPLGYLELTATEYHRMWLLHPRKHPDLAPKYNAFLQREAPLPYQDLLGVEGQPTPAAEQKFLYRLNRGALALIGIMAALFALVLAYRHRTGDARAALSLLVGSQAVLVFSAMVAVGLPRYAMGMWPMLIVGVLLGLSGLLDRWKPHAYRLRGPGWLRPLRGDHAPSRSRSALHGLRPGLGV